MRKKRNLDSYPFTLRRLSDEEGGGFLIEYPDLPGVMSDGETTEEAIRNGRDALDAALRTQGDLRPRKGSGPRP